MPLKQYFEEFLRRRPQNKSGYINLPMANFTKMLNKVKTEEEYNIVKDAHYQWIGNRNFLKQAQTDEYIMKALQLGKPELAFDTISNHAELLTHPSEEVIGAFLDHFKQQDGFDSLKEFFNMTKGKYFLKRPVGFHTTIINEAFEAGDKETVIEAYLDILDYERELAGNDGTVFKQVLESMTYEEATDHVLFGHIKEQMEKQSLDCRQYSAVYYLNISGGLTAADLLNEVASDAKVPKLDNSELFKNEFVQKIVHNAEAEEKIDEYVLEKITGALKSCHESNKIDLEFYENLNDLLGVKQAEPEVEPEAEKE